MYGALHSSISVITIKKNVWHQLARDELAETESASPEQRQTPIVIEYLVRCTKYQWGCSRLWNKVNLFLAVFSYLCFYQLQL